MDKPKRPTRAEHEHAVQTAKAQRLSVAYKLRQQGLTHAAIGRAMGVSTTRAWQMVRIFEMQRAAGNPLYQPDHDG